MTRNQIDALRMQEERRHNLESESLDRRELPAKYISSVGSVLKGITGFSKGKSKLGNPKWKI